MDVGADLGVTQGLAQMVPGPELATAVAGLWPDRASLPHEAAADLAVAAARVATWARAMSLGATLDVALRRADPEDPCAHGAAPDRNSAPYVGVLLARTEKSAAIEVGFGFDLDVRLPMLLPAMLAARISEQAARALCEMTRDLPDDLARHVCEEVLNGAAGKTPAAVRAEAARVAIGADPGLAERLYQRAVARRDVIGKREPDGTMSILARHMPVEDGAAARGGVEALARAAKRRGDPRPLGHLREAIVTGLLSRAWAGLTDAEILDQLSATRPDRDHPDGPDDLDDPDDDGPDWPEDPGPCDPRPDDDGLPEGDADPDYDEDRHDGDDPHPLDEGTAETSPAGASTGSAPPVLRAPARGIDLRVELSTLLGSDEHPAELARWGPITAPLARNLAYWHGGGNWRFALTDPEGYLITADRLDTRPTGYPRRDTRYRSSVELILTTADLQTLNTAGLDPAWAKIIAEIGRRAAEALERPPPDPTRRFADARLRRKIQARTPMCTWPFCREPAIDSEIDHAHDHSLGGATDEANQWPRCKRHHALKTSWGWQTRITGPMTYDLVSHLDTVHPVTLPPAWTPAPTLRPAWRRHLHEFRS